jgi:hypothetical protein
MTNRLGVVELVEYWEQSKRSRFQSLNSILTGVAEVLNARGSDKTNRQISNPASVVFGHLGLNLKHWGSSETLLRLYERSGSKIKLVCNVPINTSIKQALTESRDYKCNRCIEKQHRK